MDTPLNTYETEKTTWRDEFEKAYVEWVDLELIDALLSSINCSVRLLCETINDTTRWPSKINKGLKTVSYPRVRDAADFLGIPPWLLFNHKEKNSKLKELFENTASIHQPIQLPYFSEYHGLYDDYLYELSKRVKEDDYYFLSKKLDALLDNKNYTDVITGNWKAVASYLDSISRNFSGGASFSYRSLERSLFKGNLRVNFTEHPRESRLKIKSGWLSLDMEQFENGHTTEYHSFLSTVISDMEWIFRQSPWIFKVETSNKQTTTLLTWHSLRKSDEFFETVSELINRKLPDANFSMNIDKRLIQNLIVPLIKKVNVFEELIQLIKEDVPHVKYRDQKKRRTNTLQILFENNILQSGDEILLIPLHQSDDFDENDPRNRATIIKELNKIQVRWQLDNKLYSISGLTRIIFKQFQNQNYSDKTHLNGNEYWRLRGVNNSLYFMAENLVSSQKTFY